MNRLKRALGVLLSLTMMAAVLPSGMLYTVVHAGVSTHTFDTTKLAKGKIDDKSVVEGLKSADNYFSVNGTALYRVGDTYVKALEIGKAGSGSVSFVVTGTATMECQVSSTGDKNQSVVALKGPDGNDVMPTGATNAVVTTKEIVNDKNGTSPITISYQNLGAGTYQIYSPASSFNRGFRFISASVTETTSDTDTRKAWSTVEAPAFGEIKQDGSSILVNYNMKVGSDGADSVTCTMKDKNGTVIGKPQTNTTTGTTGSFKFTPSASGDYSFSLSASRTGETDKTAEDTTFMGYALPLSAPSFSSATSMGNGKEALVWSTVKEADAYEVSYSADGTTFSAPVEVKDTQYTVEGLTVGTKYTFKVAAKRTAPAGTSEAATIQATPKSDAENVWSYADFGTNATTDSAKAGFSGSANEGSVSVWNLKNSGKLVPASTDGLSYYYTAVPSSQNFTLEADVNVDAWTYTNGQEGFGLMACDRVGANGDGTAFWNNSYMDSVTKVEYHYADGAVTDDATASKYTMKLGVGSQEKVGVTASDLSQPVTNIPSTFTSTMDTLETSCANNDAGTYNIVGNATNAVAGTVAQPATKFHMSIQRNNTGYFVSYTDAEGNTTTKKYYDTKALDQLDQENVYVGFFASRTCKITCSNISLKTIDPKNDAPAEKQPTTDVTPLYQFVSADTCNSAAYTLQFAANADGSVAIKDQNGTEVANTAVKANEVVNVPVTLTDGTNKYTAVMTPDANYMPGKNKKMASYDAQTVEKTVTYKALKSVYTDNYIFAGAEGKTSGDGSRENPVDVYTAVKYAQPGQKIVLLSGTYNLTSTLTIQRGTDGTDDAKIYMVADSQSSERPILNFGGNCEGLVVAGNNWYFSGFDVTGSQNGKDGIRLCGSHDTFDSVNAYKNGNTGLQISRYTGTDTTKESWPHDNLILNCTSHENADAGYEDADGFAAKLTVGDNNVFDGCVSYNNADDGWDLFAKPETGSIGAVTIQNCVAFANGYGVDGTNEGNGNGFKLGGSSLSGKHILRNCVSFDNKSKGIDSNSCPDINVINCTSYNNGLPNVALYTNDAANTDFSATGVLSYRTQYTETADNIKLKGTQDTSKVYNATNYYWPVSSASSNLLKASSDTSSVDASWFVSLDTHFDYSKHVYSSLPVVRNADNTVNMNGLLVLSQKGVEQVGLNTDGKYISGAYLNTYDGVTAGSASTVFDIPASPEKIKTPVTPVSPETPTTPKTPAASAAPAANADQPADQLPSSSQDEVRAVTPNTKDQTNAAMYLAVLMAVLAASVFAYHKLHNEEN